MSCVGEITSNTDFRIKEKNIVDLLNDIKNHNLKWQIPNLDNIFNIESLYDYLGFVSFRDDYEKMVVVQGGGYLDDDADYFMEILEIIAKYVDNYGLIEVNYEDYNEIFRYEFKDMKVKKYERTFTWKEVE